MQQPDDLRKKNLKHNIPQQCIFLKTGIFDFSKKYWFKITQDTTQMIFRLFQAKLGPVKFFHFLLIKW